MSTSTSGPATSRPRAASATVDGRLLRVTLEDGREIGVPLAWFRWLEEATESQRGDLAIIEGGAGIWWEQLDDGISVPGLLGLPEFP
jgi:Protein of unknown function (DUF2442)